MTTRYISLGFFLLVVLAASAFGAGFEAGAWYQEINKPEWTPPDWFYGPALAFIYVLMALAAWRIWLCKRSVRVGAVLWWVLLLALNIAWSWMMFELHRPGMAFLLSGIVLGVAIMCCRAFFLLSRQAGLLLTPFAIWAGFIACLNYTIWTMNEGGFRQLIG